MVSYLRAASAASQRLVGQSAGVNDSQTRRKYNKFVTEGDTFVARQPSFGIVSAFNPGSKT